MQQLSTATRDADTGTSGFRIVMLPLDGSEFADRAIGLTAQLASAMHSKVILVDVVEEHTGPSPFNIEAARNKEQRAAVAHLQAAKARLQAAGVQDVEIHLLPGSSPSRAIAESATELHCDAIVMSTHGRSGVMRVLQGSVAEDVVRHLPGVPVLMVRAAA